MGVRTPWCPRCGAWRGYVLALCKGCTKIENSITTDMLVQKKVALLEAAQTPEQKAAIEALDPTVHGEGEGKLRAMVLRDLVQERFTKISEMRTDREAFTQSLEQMVEEQIDTLKEVCYAWMRMRPESRRVRFANMYAQEVIQVARLALEELGALSLEVTHFTENKAVHEERMQRVMSWMQVVNKFEIPDENDPKEPAEEEDLPPGQEES